MDVNARCAVPEREIKRDKETAEVDAGDEPCGEGEGERPAASEPHSSL